MSRAFRAVAVFLVAIWMVPGIASFAVGVHLIVDHHHHHEESDHEESALEENHHHSPATSADQLHDLVPGRRVLDRGALVAVAMIGASTFHGADLAIPSAVRVPPRLVPPSVSLLQTLCALLI